MTKTIKQPSAKAVGEFVSEAQEILENLGRDLMALDRTPTGSEKDPERINDLFRGMHTLKSLSGMFGVTALMDLTHQEESLLEEVRLGRVPFNDVVLNLLFESIEVITRILNDLVHADEIEDAGLVAATEELIYKIARAAGGPDLETAGGRKSSENPAALIGQDVMEVLTEYEEHRLKANLKKGLPIYRIGMLFDLESIDVKLEKVRSKLKPLGEIVTYLPSSDESNHEKLGIDIILVLLESRGELNRALTGMSAKIVEVVPAAAPEEPPRSPTLPPSEPPAPESPPKTDGPPALKSTTLSSGIVSAGQKDQTLGLRSVNQTVRVDIRKLDSLMNVVGELGVVRNAIAKMSAKMSQIIGHSDLTIELDQMNRGFERRLAALREGILEVRMVPLKQTFDRLARMVRGVSKELHKDIHFVVSGADTEVDKLITEEILSPLMHLIRNAIDHGVESSAERTHVGKPEFGTIALTAYQKGSHVVVAVEDDGDGIDTERLVVSAMVRHLIDEEQAASLSPREVTNLIFMPGVTTSRETTEISGRGMGMDIVKTTVSALGGIIEVLSERFIGTKFTITLPVTLATIPGLLVAVGGKTYAIPLNTVTEAIFAPRREIQSILGNETISLRGETLVLCRLTEFFGLPNEEEDPDELCVVVVTMGHQRLGLVVDTLHSQQDVVVKPLGRILKDITCFSGATDIGEERLALVIDTAQVVDAFFSNKEGHEPRARLASPS